MNSTEYQKYVLCLHSYRDYLHIINTGLRWFILINDILPNLTEMVLMELVQSYTTGRSGTNSIISKTIHVLNKNYIRWTNPIPDRIYWHTIAKKIDKGIVFEDPAEIVSFPTFETTTIHIPLLEMDNANEMDKKKMPSLSEIHEKIEKIIQRIIYIKRIFPYLVDYMHVHAQGKSRTYMIVLEAIYTYAKKYFLFDDTDLLC